MFGLVLVSDGQNEGPLNNGSDIYCSACSPLVWDNLGLFHMYVVPKTVYFKSFRESFPFIPEIIKLIIIGTCNTVSVFSGEMRRTSKAPCSSRAKNTDARSSACRQAQTVRGNHHFPSKHLRSCRARSTYPNFSKNSFCL